MNQKIILALLFIVFGCQVYAQDADSLKTQVYTFKIFREIGSTSWIHTQEAFAEAEAMKADMILLHMNTYGGQVVFADSIRTKILNSHIPVHVFIDNNAASAGALISIACDSIYMRPGANIGAATVVNQSGEKMPDKYQSYMRSTIRATAEAHGKDTLVAGQDTTYAWRRDPHIAEAMVDESIYIENIVDTGKILTFTTLEAIEHGFCEGQANSIDDVLKQLKVYDYEITTFKPSFYDGLKGFLTSPILQGILILVIIGGIYFELQTPGVGFPLLAASIAAVLYFSPLYIDGLAANWEIIIFIIGLVLIGLEVFVIPGFGVAGVSGIILVMGGLTLSLLDNDLFNFDGVGFNKLLEALGIVLSGLFGSLLGIIYLSKKLLSSPTFGARIALQTEENVELGYIGVEASLKSFVGCEAEAYTTLRPSGKITIDDEQYDAVAESGYIEKGTKVKVVRFLHGQLYVMTIK
ncbi:nodulation protein NfeD [Carboxylicivirga mesophila]|uniref:Nodulation protein NfeD n=1 Tax=Carboxylicivirga mesophila TaxID=1166478 RepID=A0ABS5KBA4_9BACT|nr:NfeD family protein [Carboxylicivirga mesophila]MBS2212216.1 nodulation protein NfeD [Carboxylicivirga mesophila]